MDVSIIKAAGFLGQILEVTTGCIPARCGFFVRAGPISFVVAAVAIKLNCLETKGVVLAISADLV